MSKATRVVVATALGMLGVACVAQSEPGPDGKQTSDPSVADTAPSGITRTVHDESGYYGSSYNIVYHSGGQIMSGTKKLYAIWYGNFSGDSTVTILTNLLQNIGGSSYFNINSTYTDGSGHIVDNAATYVGSYNDNYSQGTALTQASVKTVVSNAISAAGWASDPNAVYVVLSSSDVSESMGGGSFCQNFCGWHDYGSINAQTLKWAWIGKPPAGCPCQPGTGQGLASNTNAPNGNQAADSMASVLAHELDEAVTDPQLNAWFDGAGNENGDKCAWHYGTVSGSAGAQYNVTLGSRNYLLQTNLTATSGNQQCVTSYTGGGSSSSSSGGSSSGGTGCNSSNCPSPHVCVLNTCF